MTSGHIVTAVHDRWRLRAVRILFPDFRYSDAAVLLVMIRNQSAWTGAFPVLLRRAETFCPGRIGVAGPVSFYPDHPYRPDADGTAWFPGKGSRRARENQRCGWNGCSSL